MSKFSRWFPFLRWPRPTQALLRGEAMAALTVAVVMIPQSVAYAGLAGMPLVTGLYATFLPMLFAVLFSASTRLSVGPSALSSVAGEPVMSEVTRLGAASSWRLCARAGRPTASPASASIHTRIRTGDILRVRGSRRWLTRRMSTGSSFS